MQNRKHLYSPFNCHNKVYIYGGLIMGENINKEGVIAYQTLFGAFPEYVSKDCQYKKHLKNIAYVLFFFSLASRKDN